MKTTLLQSAVKRFRISPYVWCRDVRHAMHRLEWFEKLLVGLCFLVWTSLIALAGGAPRSLLIVFVISESLASFYVLLAFVERLGVYLGKFDPFGD
ncbi:MAG: hypothetical protein U0796_17895 [Gemmatales bacterium]